MHHGRPVFLVALPDMWHTVGVVCSNARECRTWGAHSTLPWYQYRARIKRPNAACALASASSGSMPSSMLYSTCSLNSCACYSLRPLSNLQKLCRHQRSSKRLQIDVPKTPWPPHSVLSTLKARTFAMKRRPPWRPPTFKRRCAAAF